MPYTHGVYVQENPTPILAPVIADSAIQFIVGTAPVNMAEDPASAVNVPILVNSYAEAVKAVGYSHNFKAFTLCQSISASFQVYNVAPLVLVNVLDPAKHAVNVNGKSLILVDGKGTVEEEGILRAGFTVKSKDGSKTYAAGVDYALSFDDRGYLVFKIVEKSTIPAGTTELVCSYQKLDPSLVDEDDIIGGYDDATGKYTGLMNIDQVYPKFAMVPGMILAPGWSHIPAVSVAMSARTEGINGAFKCIAVKDVDTTAVKAYSAANEWKRLHSYTGKNDIVLWPKLCIDDRQYYYSAVWAALMAYTDYNNDNVPYVSPSNTQLRITGTVLEDGSEIYLDQVQGNTLNGQGIITAININGWRSWGNNTGIYPGSSDVKDRFIPVRRMFNWWGNTFILTYFQKVDDPMNRRLIETVVDTENIRANGYKARFQLADARIEYRMEDNPVTDLLNGVIRFKQYLTPFTPAETIIDVLEFDPGALAASLGGEA